MSNPSRLKEEQEMKTSKSTLILAFVLLVIVQLVFRGGNLQAGSKSSTFQMISDVICGTGGGAQSASFTLNASAGGQGSPVGPHSSPNFSGGGGWVYTTGPDFVRGDANGDGEVGPGDVVYLLNYLYRGGPPPCPMAAGDANCDGAVGPGDVVYLINYLFRGGPAPCSGKGGQILALASELSYCPGDAEISLLLKTELTQPAFAKASTAISDAVSEIAVVGNFDRDVAMVHLEIDFDPDQVTLLEPALTSLTKDLQLITGTQDGTQKIGIVDLSGKNSAPAGEGALVKLRAKGDDLSSIKIRKAILIDRDAMRFDLELSGELELEVAKGSDSRPEDFSLSQNYPNPFNPQTSIRYALPQDAQVRLVIYNLLGRKVKTLVDERQSAGHKTVWWDGKDEKGDPAASGVYFYRIDADQFSEVKKMMLVK
jgi:hypothetical protein